MAIKKIFHLIIKNVSGVLHLPSLVLGATNIQRFWVILVVVCFSKIRKEYFTPFPSFLILLESIPGVPKIKCNYNPAAWVLEVSSMSVEKQLGIDFSQVYRASSLYR